MSSRGARTAAPPVKSSHSGAAGRERALALLEQQEAEREARLATPLMPFRFRMDVGDAKEVVVVDDAPDFFRTEHNLQDPRSKRYDVYLPCIDEHTNCPACSKSSRPAYYAMYLTIIDINPYISTKTGEEIPFSKKLLVVKPMQQKKILRYYERHGTLRGMILLMTRDGDKDASIGDPEFVEFMSEEDLQTYVSEYTDKEGVVHETLCYEPYDYEALFPDMSEAQLSALVGGGASAGSRHADDRAIGRTRGRGAAADEEPAEGDWEEAPRRVATRRAPAAAAPEPAQRAARPAARRAAAPIAEEEPLDPEDTLDGEQLPWDDENAPEAEPEEAPAAPARRTARAPVRGASPAVAPARTAAPVRSARRAAPEPVVEEAPARAGIAARRAALRR